MPGDNATPVAPSALGGTDLEFERNRNPITLTRFLLDEQKKFRNATGNFAMLLQSIQLAGTRLRRQGVACWPLSGWGCVAVLGCGSRWETVHTRLIFPFFDVGACTSPLHVLLAFSAALPFP